MAKFITTNGISYHLEQLIQQTEDKLILISPYLQFSSKIKEEIQNLNLLKRDIRIIYRENKLSIDDNKWLQSQYGIRSSLCENLHAKCYINEKQGIITSMNLYEYSQQNNNEMGIFFTKEEDSDIYENAYKEANRLLRVSKEVQLSIREVKNDNRRKYDSKESDVHHGYCIRTGVEIPFDMNKPMCREAYYEWNIWGNPDYRENYCHYSGEPSYGETSKAEPVLRKNLDAAIELQNKLHPDIISICRK